VVTLSEEQYQRLLQKADLWEPLLPEPLPNGNYPAREYIEASLARKIIRDRPRLGLTQAEFARRAGIRLETLNRAESGKSTPSISTIKKIDRALKQAEAANDCKNLLPGQITPGRIRTTHTKHEKNPRRAIRQRTRQRIFSRFCPPTWRV
jgi:transcriptional regulator with XRE-family HTH domain